MGWSVSGDNKGLQKTKGSQEVCVPYTHIVCMHVCVYVSCRWKYQAIPCQFMAEIMNDMLQLIVKAGCSAQQMALEFWTEVPRLYLIP